MTTQHRLATIALVAAVLLAGCGAGGGGFGTADGGDGGDGEPMADGSATMASGTLAFYISDQPTAIGDFESLTVTVTEIGVHRAGSGDDEEMETTTEGTETTSTETTSTETTTEGTETTTSTETTTDGTETTTSTETTSEGTETSTETTEAEDGDESGSDAGWTTHAVDNETVDLTELQGEDARKIADLELPAGEYNGVYLVVSDVNGTLTTGETVDVKLPSERLRLNKGFTIGADETASFVFDIAVHEAGGSGKYVLRPVISQSGSDVPINDVGARGGSDDDTETEEPDAEAEASGGPPEDRPSQANGGGRPTTDATTTEAETSG